MAGLGWSLCLFLLCCYLTFSVRPSAQPELGLDDGGTPLDAFVALAEEGDALEQEPPDVEVSQSELPWYKKFTNLVSEQTKKVAAAVKHRSKKAVAAVMQNLVRIAIHQGLVQHKIEQTLGTRVKIEEMDFTTFGTEDAEGKLVIKGIKIYNTVFANDSKVEYLNSDDGTMVKARDSEDDFQHLYNRGCQEGKADKERCNLIARIARVEITGTDFFKAAGWATGNRIQKFQDMRTSKGLWKGPKAFEFEHLIIEDVVLYVNVRKRHTNIGRWVSLKKKLTAWKKEKINRKCCSKTGAWDKPYCDSNYTSPIEQMSPEAKEDCRKKQMAWWKGYQIDYKSVQLKNLKVKLLYPTPTKTAASAIKMLSDYTLKNEAAAKKNITGTSMKSAAVMLSAVMKALGKMSNSILRVFTAGGLHEAEEAAVHLALGDDAKLEDLDELSDERVRDKPVLSGLSISDSLKRLFLARQAAKKLRPNHTNKSSTENLSIST